MTKQFWARKDAAVPAPLSEAVFPFVYPALCALCGGRSSLSVGNVNLISRRGAAARIDRHPQPHVRASAEQSEGQLYAA